MAAGAPAADPPLACGNCARPMYRLHLAGHYGRRVELDLCPACHLVWFDLTEGAHLAGPGLLALIGEMAAAQSVAHEVLRPGVACPHCRGPLKTIHNQTRWGRSLQLECVARHGAWQTFAQFLGEKGLLRPVSSADRARLLARDGRIDCVNCGAALGATDEQCPYCTSVPGLLDVARLARALDPEGATEAHPVHRTGAQPSAMQCAACGAALPPGLAMDCAQCGATLAVGRLAAAHAAVVALAPALRAHAERPAPHVVKRRLEGLDADKPRRREWVRAMEAEAKQGDPDESDWAEQFGAGTSPWRAVALALAIWFAWWFWPR